MGKGNVLLAAGGTGGHLFPAEALAHQLIKRGYDVYLATDVRGNKFADDFPSTEKRIISSATMTSKNPIALFRMFLALFKGYRQSKAFINEIKPVAVVGFGGYPALPPLLAANMAGLPSLIHEQNAILGRANRAVASRVKGIAVGFRQVGQKPSAPVVETGNPIRPNVERVMNTPYADRENQDPFRLVVFGGSQGARFFSEALPPALELMDKKQREKLSILQQARQEDEEALRAAYKKLGVNAEIAPFFKDIPEEIADSHFVIARAGAGSVTEIAVIGRPCLLVPLPGSLDGDQAANAIAMSENGGGFVVKQSELSAEKLASIIIDAMDSPGQMAEMAAAAKKTGIPDAAERLADCVEYVISGQTLSDYHFEERKPS